MRIPKWMRLEINRSNTHHRRDGEDEPKAPKGPKDAPAPPPPGPSGLPPPPKGPGPLKTLSVTLTTTMTMTSTTTSLSTTSTSSAITTTSSSISSSLSSKPQEATFSTISSTSSPASLTGSPQQSTVPSNPVPTLPNSSIDLRSSSQAQISTTTSFTADAVSTTSIIPSSSQQPPSLTLSIPPTSSSIISSQDLQTSLPTSRVTPSTEGNRNLPPTSTSSSAIQFNSATSSAIVPVSPSESPISSPNSSSIPDTSLSTKHSPTAGRLVLIGVAVGASAAILVAIILFLCRRRTIKKQRGLASSYNVPRPTNKRMSWSSQPIDDAHGGEIPSIVFASSQSRQLSNSQSPASQTQSVLSNPNAGVGELTTRAQQFTAGGRFVPQPAPQSTVQIGGVERNVSSATAASQRTQMQEATMVYEDQLPAFAARLKELGITGAGMNGTSVTDSSTGSSTIGGYAPQLQIPEFDLGGGQSSQLDPYGWFGSTMTSSTIGSQVQAPSSQVEYVVSPISQRSVAPIQSQAPIQTQQTPWQVRLPDIAEARRGSQTSSNIDNETVYELSGDGMQSASGGVPKWRDPLAVAREQRFQ